jgi:1-acyl-sn-glycerol-3-phosphate acyltransferase
MTRLIPAFIRAFAGVYEQKNLMPPGNVRIYFANHSSHLDFVVIWSVLPKALRERTRPVAAADYWTKGALRSHLANHVFHALLITREDVTRTNNPLEQMVAALAAGNDLILFPEGTRSADGQMRPFKAGLFHLARRFPNAELLPVHLENLNRILPKGEFLPAPLLGGVSFGEPLPGPQDGESKTDFLHRAQKAVFDLGPHSL